MSEQLNAAFGRAVDLSNKYRPQDARLSVYLAGKIAKNDWRHGFAHVGTGPFASDLFPWYPRKERFLRHEHLQLVGPFFTACDHGCGHYLDHAMWAADLGVGHDPDFACGDGFSTDRASVAWRCIDWIDNADIVIAIVDDDAQGTIFEVGYATAKRIPVIALEGGNCKEAWFPLHAPGVTRTSKSINEIVDQLNDYIGRRYDLARKCESPIERKFLEEMVRSGSLSDFDVAVSVLGGKYRIDFADIDRKIGIELDGHAYHSSKEQFERDRVRQRELEGHGWRFIRFAGAEIMKDVSKCVREAEEMARSFSA